VIRRGSANDKAAAPGTIVQASMADRNISRLIMIQYAWK
jgi:hypothetical protein